MARKVHNGPHKYRRIEMGRDKTPAYRCMLPGCLHYVLEDFIVGQTSLCNKCEKQFLVTRNMLFPRKIIKLHCPECSRPTYNRASKQVMRGRAVVKGIEHSLSDTDILSLIRTPLDAPSESVEAEKEE